MQYKAEDLTMEIYHQNKGRKVTISTPDGANSRTGDFMPLDMFGYFGVLAGIGQNQGRYEIKPEYNYVITFA